MKKTQILTVLICITVFTSYSQTTNNELKGVVLDLDKKTALPYGNIVVLQKNTGTITNEKGEFSLDITKLAKNDVVSFQYIGYQSKNISIADLEKTSKIYLKEDIFNIAEVFVFGTNPKPKTIIKKVLENKEKNYKRANTKRQIFIRERFISDITNFDIEFEKSTIEELNEETIKLIKDKIPRHSTSYTDFLGYVYFSKNEEDTANVKIAPIKTVSLKEKDITDLKQLETRFNKLFANTKEKEYWKMKSGIFGGKVQFLYLNELANVLTNYHPYLQYFQRLQLFQLFRFHLLIHQLQLQLYVE